MSQQAITERARFDLIRYANCWEDADILLEGLEPKPGSKILSVGSAGDNSFSLLVNDPEIVVAVDVNKIQLYLVELKCAMIKCFSREEALAFLGFTQAENRSLMLERLTKELSPEPLEYWKNNKAQINNGIIYEGKFEKYFILFSQKILPGSVRMMFMQSE